MAVPLERTGFPASTGGFPIFRSRVGCFTFGAVHSKSKSAGRSWPLVVIGCALAAAKATQFRWWPDPTGALLVPGLVRQAIVGSVLVIAVGPRAHRAEARVASPWRWLLALAAIGVIVRIGAGLPLTAVVNLLVVTAIGEELLPLGAGARAADASPSGS